MHACMCVHICMCAANCQPKLISELVNADLEAELQTSMARKETVRKLAGISAGGMTQFPQRVPSGFLFVDKIRQVRICVCVCVPSPCMRVNTVHICSLVCVCVYAFPHHACKYSSHMLINTVGYKAYILSFAVLSVGWYLPQYGLLVWF